MVKAHRKTYNGWKNYLSIKFPPRTFFEQMFFAIVFLSVRAGLEIVAVGPRALTFYHHHIAVTFDSNSEIVDARTRYLRIDDDGAGCLENIDFKLLGRCASIRGGLVLRRYLLLFFVVV